MSTKKKAGEVLPKIISANTREQAIGVLKEVLEALYISNDYTELVSIKDSLNNCQSDFEKLRQRYRALEVPRKFEDVHNIRTDINFLYSHVSDTFSFDVNRLKIYYEETKTSVRASSMVSLKHDEEFQKEIKATSTSALRDVVGASESYKEYVSLASISYGLYQDLRDFLNSMRQLTDSMASECSYLRTIQRIDAK